MQDGGKLNATHLVRLLRLILADVDGMASARRRCLRTANAARIRDVL
jgi:hypothetical protein